MQRHLLTLALAAAVGCGTWAFAADYSGGASGSPSTQPGGRSSQTPGASNQPSNLQNNQGNWQRQQALEGQLVNLRSYALGQPSAMGGGTGGMRGQPGTPSGTPGGAGATGGMPGYSGGTSSGNTGSSSGTPTGGGSATGGQRSGNAFFMPAGLVANGQVYTILADPLEVAQYEGQRVRITGRINDSAHVILPTKFEVQQGASGQYRQVAVSSITSNASLPGMTASEK